jgi:hypothetical protein
MLPRLDLADCNASKIDKMGTIFRVLIDAGPPTYYLYSTSRHAERIASAILQEKNRHG